MVINIVLSVVAAVATMYATAGVVRALDGGGFATLLGQLLTVGVLAGVLFGTGFVSLIVASGLVTLVIALRVFAILWFWYLGRKYLNGDYGEKTQWAAELAKEKDEEFIEAASRLSDMEMTEVGIISDSKEELRENVIEEAEN